MTLVLLVVLVLGVLVMFFVGFREAAQVESGAVVDRSRLLQGRARERQGSGSAGAEDARRHPRQLAEDARQERQRRPEGAEEDSARALALRGCEKPLACAVDERFEDQRPVGRTRADQGIDGVLWMRH